MAFYGLHFLFDDQYSKNYGLTIAAINGNSTTEASGGSNIEIFYDSVYRKPKKYIYGSSPEEVLTFEMEVVSEKPLYGLKRSKIQKWLFGRTKPCKLQIIQSDLQDIYFNCFLTDSSLVMVTLPQRKRIADFLHGQVDASVVSPPYFYVGLVTGSVDANGNITGEVTGGGYKRVKIANSKDNFSNADDTGSVSNTVVVEFAESTESWGNITYVFLSDVQSGGKAYYYIPLETMRSVPAYTTVLFKSGDIQLTVGN